MNKSDTIFLAGRSFHTEYIFSGGDPFIPYVHTLYSLIHFGMLFFKLLRLSFSSPLVALEYGVYHNGLLQLTSCCYVDSFSIP